MHSLARCALAAGDRVLDGYVAACGDGTLMLRADHGVRGELRVGDDVQVLVLDDVRGEVRYSGRVARVSVTTVYVADLELRSMLQKRQVARVKIAQLCTGVLQSSQDADRSITFVVLDLGAHGMRISTTARLTEQDRITFQFPTPDRAVPLDAEVLRSQRTRTRSTHYGCRFVGLREREADALFRFVMQTQAAQRRTRLLS
ncbi:PilZ domain-containing protein [Cellulomonas sp. URHD0024]|uniref:PilZ domain-containing protein n=1 Tax=Cellulomonas sp. URHD0024 TaxID=1302620 RepID=UPI0004106325|nr:PilZ domain-containing protein [Cellulomonas sp. URHD0024]